jgi:hypothetical protein
VPDARAWEVGENPNGAERLSQEASLPAAVFHHPVGRDQEIRLWLGRDESGFYIELGAYLRMPGRPTRASETFELTDAGLRIPADLAARIGAQLQGLGLWADREAKRGAPR